VHQHAAWHALQSFYGRTSRGGAPSAGDDVRLPGDRAPQRLSLRDYPQGLLSAAGHGAIIACIRADQSISFHAMRHKSGSSCESSSRIRYRQAVAGFHRTDTRPILASCFATFEAARRAHTGRRPGDRSPASKLSRWPARSFSSGRQDIRVGGRHLQFPVPVQPAADALPNSYTWGPNLLEPCADTFGHQPIRLGPAQNVLQSTS